jgi:hypothetical protein
MLRHRPKMATATRRRAYTAGLHPDMTVVEAAAVKVVV